MFKGRRGAHSDTINGGPPDLSLRDWIHHDWIHHDLIPHALEALERHLAPLIGYATQRRHWWFDQETPMDSRDWTSGRSRVCVVEKGHRERLWELLLWTMNQSVGVWSQCPDLELAGTFERR